MKLSSSIKNLSSLVDRLHYKSAVDRIYGCNQRGNVQLRVVVVVAVVLFI